MGPHHDHGSDSHGDDALELRQLTELFLKSLNVLSKIKKITEAAFTHSLGSAPQSTSGNSLHVATASGVSIAETVTSPTAHSQQRRTKKNMSTRRASAVPVLSWYALPACLSLSNNPFDAEMQSIITTSRTESFRSLLVPFNERLKRFFCILKR
ncbi:hypothetical protein MDAP_000947 [Mitosporidium daphniae]